jgi:hypothetical protein
MGQTQRGSHAYKAIISARDFEELKSSTRHRARPHYVKLLRSFLVEDNKTLQGSVFPHGDLKISTVMVRTYPENVNHFVVTGTINREDGDFYLG